MRFKILAALALLLGAAFFPLLALGQGEEYSIQVENFSSDEQGRLAANVSVLRANALPFESSYDTPAVVLEFLPDAQGRLVMRAEPDDGNAYIVTTQSFAPGEEGAMLNLIGSIMMAAPPPPGGDPPDAVADLGVTPGDASAALSWSAVDGADHYDVYRSTTSGSGFAKINGADVETNSYDDTGLTNGTTYYWHVVAVSDDNGESDPSNEVSGAPAAAFSPEGVENTNGFFDFTDAAHLTLVDTDRISAATNLADGGLDDPVAVAGSSHAGPLFDGGMKLPTSTGEDGYLSFGADQDLGESFTIIFSARADSAGQYNILGSQSSGDRSRVEINANSGTSRVDVEAESKALSTLAVSVGATHIFTLVKDGVNASLYQDGALVATMTFAASKNYIFNYFFRSNGQTISPCTVFHAFTNTSAISAEDRVAVEGWMAEELGLTLTPAHALENLPGLQAWWGMGPDDEGGLTKDASGVQSIPSLTAVETGALEQSTESLRPTYSDGIFFEESGDWDGARTIGLGLGRVDLDEAFTLHVVAARSATGEGLLFYSATSSQDEIILRNDGDVEFELGGHGVVTLSGLDTTAGTYIYTFRKSGTELKVYENGVLIDTDAAVASGGDFSFGNLGRTAGADGSSGLTMLEVVGYSAAHNDTQLAAAVTALAAKHAGVSLP